MFVDGINNNILNLYNYNSGQATLNFSYSFSGSLINHLALNAIGTLLSCVNDN